MATLISAYTPDESKKASILTGKPNRVTVEVEDNLDRAFWRDLLSELCPEKELHFNCYQTIVKGKEVVFKKGKARIIKMADTLNDYHIGCVDSDYDWLLSDYTDDGKVITGNKYLLQTYAYSIENLMCLSSTLGDFCHDATEEATNFEFADYMTKLSQTVFPLLIWSLYLYSQGNEAFAPSAWRDVLVNTIRDAETSLAQIAEKTKEEVEAFVKDYAAETDEKDKLEAKLAEEKSVNSGNAYLFVRGHELFDHLLNSVLGPIMITLRQEHYKKLQDSDSDTEKRKTCLQSYRANEVPVRQLLSHNCRYKGQTELYDKIAQDVAMIWKEVNDKVKSK